VYQVDVFWVVTPCSVMVGYRRFGGLRQYGPRKRWYPTTTLHGVTTRNTTTWNPWKPRSSQGTMHNLISVNNTVVTVSQSP